MEGRGRQDREKEAILLKPVQYNNVFYNYFFIIQVKESEVMLVKPAKKQHAHCI